MLFILNQSDQLYSLSVAFYLVLNVLILSISINLKFILGYFSEFFPCLMQNRLGTSSEEKNCVFSDFNE